MTELGKYEILEEIGRGGFAVVYKARDTELDRIVALKVLHSHWTADLNFATRFRREARAAARLRHHSIATVYEVGETEGQLYIAMEYLPGRTLRALLEAEGALPLERALPILKQIAEALDRAHAQGVIHCDVKPDNVHNKFDSFFLQFFHQRAGIPFTGFIAIAHQNNHCFFFSCFDVLCRESNRLGDRRFTLRIDGLDLFT